jgi:hypothetical protein
MQSVQCFILLLLVVNRSIKREKEEKEKEKVKKKGL